MPQKPKFDSQTFLPKVSSLRVKLFCPGTPSLTVKLFFSEKGGAIAPNAPPGYALAVYKSECGSEYKSKCKFECESTCKSGCKSECESTCKSECKSTF